VSLFKDQAEFVEKKLRWFLPVYIPASDVILHRRESDLLTSAADLPKEYSKKGFYDSSWFAFESSGASQPQLPPDGFELYEGISLDEIDRIFALFGESCRWILFPWGAGRSPTASWCSYRPRRR